MIIATDLDRTLISNGKAKKETKTYVEFKQKVKNHILVYNSGRDLYLTKQAIKRYNLPKPDFLICSVGTKIYYKKNNDFLEFKDWNELIKKDWKNKTSTDIRKILKKLKTIQEQPRKNNNKYKQSYYFPLNKEIKPIIKKIKKILKYHNLKCSVITSTDGKKYFIDILPKSVDKLSALLFISKIIKVKKNKIVFSGDSENDLSVICGGVKGILVKNSFDSVKLKVNNFVKQNPKYKKLIYIAKGNFGYSGNYVSGILEGGKHFKIW